MQSVFVLEDLLKVPLQHQPCLDLEGIEETSYIISPERPGVEHICNLGGDLPPPSKFVRKDNSRITTRSRMHVSSIISIRKATGRDIAQYEPAKWSTEQHGKFPQVG